MTKKLNEQDLVNGLINHLKRYFYYELEVWSKDEKRRIDIVITDKKNKDVSFGIECKSIDKKKGDDIGKHILQALRYNFKEFLVNGTYKRIPIFIAPPISYNFLICPDLKEIINNIEYFSDRHDKNNKHHTINGLLGAMCLGEIRTIETNRGKNTIITFSNNIIWTNKQKWVDGKYVNDYIGTDLIKYNKLIDKIKNFNIND